MGKIQILSKKLWIPLNIAYLVGRNLHKGYFSLHKSICDKGLTPLIVIGSLRAGGSSKTGITRQLAHILSNKGYRIAILAYRIGHSQEKGNLIPVNYSWESTSDEALMMKMTTRLPVFVTRNRLEAWRELSKTGKFDIILSDDGFQDTRLKNAFQIAIVRPGDNPGILDLLPGGRFRETSKSLKRADMILTGPLALSNNFNTQHPGFKKKIIFPPDFKFCNPWLVCCALGDNAQFLEALKDHKVNIQRMFTKPDHHPFPLAFLEKLLSKFSGSHILMTEKDWIKHNMLPLEGQISVVKEEIVLSPSFWKGLKSYLPAPKATFTRGIKIPYLEVYPQEALS